MHSEPARSDARSRTLTECILIYIISMKYWCIISINWLNYPISSFLGRYYNELPNPFAYLNRKSELGIVGMLTGWEYRYAPVGWLKLPNSSCRIATSLAFWSLLSD